MTTTHALVPQQRTVGLSPDTARTLARARKAPVPTPRGVDPTMPEPMTRTRVRLPMSVTRDARHRDLAVVLHAKVTHLAKGPDGCTAALTTIAAWLGLKNRVVTTADGHTTLKPPSALCAAQKDLTDTRELATRRRTKRGGTGTTAIRVVRAMTTHEEYVWVPVAILGAVPPRHVRAYILIAGAHARGHQITIAELASCLRHHSGRHAGECISERAAAVVVDELEEWGWVAIERRAGRHGRNLIAPRRSPLEAAPEPELATRQRDSGSEGERYSLAYSEDGGTDRQTSAASPGGSARSALESVEAGARLDGAVPAPVAPSAEPPRVRVDLGPRRGRASISPYAVSVFRSAPRLVDALTPGQQVIAARWIDAARTADPDQLRSRIARRVGAETAEIRNPLGWLRNRALPRRGCLDPECEDGWLWLPLGAGAQCRNCARNREDTRFDSDALYGAERRVRVLPGPSWDPPAARPAPQVMGTCDDCDRALPGVRGIGLCLDCTHDRRAAAS